MKTIAQYEELSGLKCSAEEYVRLDDARLIFSDVPRFTRDHAEVPATQHTAALEEEARQVLLRAGTVISRPHTVPNALHKPPSVTGAPLTGYRPPRYGRAALFELGGMETDAQAGFRDGVIDIKGCGVASDRTPELGGTRTGMLFMHEALTELINQVLLDRLITRDDSQLSTVPF